MKQNGILIVSFFSVFLFATSPTDALTTTDSATPLRTTIKERVTKTRETIRDTIKERREDLKETIKQKREDTKERFKEAREQFKERLASITAEKKRLMVQRIDEKMTAVNKRRTDHMVAVLEKLSNILDRIEKKASEAAAREVDTSAVDTAIKKAHTALDAASDAVSQQAGEDYVVTIGTETGIKNAVGSVMKSLQTDLRNAHKLVVDAKQAVMNAARELAKIGGKRMMKDGTTATGAAE